MEPAVGIESIDVMRHDLFIAYFSDGTYLEITAEQLRKRFADLVMPIPELDDE